MKTICRGNLPLLVGATSRFLSIPFVHSNVLDGIERKGKSSMYHLCVCLMKRTRLLHQPKRTHMIYGVSHPYDCNRHSLIQTIKANQTVELLVLLASELFQAINRFLSSFVESQRFSKEFFSFFRNHSSNNFRVFVDKIFIDIFINIQFHNWCVFADQEHPNIHDIFI